MSEYKLVCGLNGASVFARGGGGGGHQKGKMMIDLIERLRNPTWADCTHDGIMEEAADEIERLQALTKWQPIETAPKDGTEILAYNRYGRMIVAWDDHDKWWVVRAEGEDVYGVDGWLIINVERIDGWKPLPEPPTEKADE